MPIQNLLTDLLASSVIFLDSSLDFYTSKSSTFLVSAYGDVPLPLWVLPLLQAALLAYVLLPANPVSLWKMVAVTTSPSPLSACFSAFCLIMTALDS